LASPQTENGYTRIANEILEQIAKVKLSPTQYRLVFVIWRYTYGFKRKEHDMSLQFFANATGCDARQIQRELKWLEQKKIIEQKPINGIGRIISFNKDYSKWVKDTSIGETDIGEIDNGETVKGSIGETVKGSIGETVKEERKILKKDIKEIIDHFEMVWKLYPNKRGKAKINDSQKEKLYELGDEIVRTIERYKATKEDWKAWQHGSTFFNTGYLDFLDKDYVEPEEEIPKARKFKVDSS